MSNGASNDGADNSQYIVQKIVRMSVHDRLGDDARDQPNEEYTKRGVNMLTPFDVRQH
jgi:hypothetical protein